MKETKGKGKIKLVKCPECKNAFYVNTNKTKNYFCPYCEKIVNLILKEKK